MEATFIVRAVTSEQVKKAMAKFSLQQNENRQYTHDAIVILEKQLLRILASQFYDGNGEGMKGLLLNTSNKLWKVKSNKVYTCSSILKASKKAAEEASTSANKTIIIEIILRVDAQEEDNRQNMFSQAVIGAK